MTTTMTEGRTIYPPDSTTLTTTIDDHKHTIPHRPDPTRPDQDLSPRLPLLLLHSPSTLYPLYQPTYLPSCLPFPSFFL